MWEGCELTQRSSVCNCMLNLFFITVSIYAVATLPLKAMGVAFGIPFNMLLGMLLSAAMCHS